MNGFHPVDALVIPSVVFHHKLRDFFVQIKSDFSRIKVHIFPCEGTPELFNLGIISSTTLAVPWIFGFRVPSRYSPIACRLTETLGPK